MADNWIQSFAVALGFDVNTSSLNTAKKSIADYEAAVRNAEKRIEDARWAGAKTEQEIAKLTRETALKEAKSALDDAKAREKVEQDQARKRTERNVAFVANLEALKLAATAAAKAIHVAVSAVTSSFDTLYFQAQRSGTSVQSLKSLGYGFSQVGGSAQQAASMVDSFTTKLRNNPGLRQFVRDLGVDGSLPGAEKTIATLDALKKQPYEIGVQYAEMLGISEENYNLFIRQGEALKQYRDEQDATAKRFGLNSEQAAAASQAFQRSLTRLQATAGVLTDKLMAALAPAIQGLIDRFQKWVDSNPGVLDKILNDIAKAVVAVAEGIGRFLSEIAGDNGEAFLKKWDEFVLRAERFAGAVERSVLGIEKLLKMTGFLNREAVPGMGGLVTGYRDWVHSTFGNGSGAGPGDAGAGAPPSADVPDNRRWYEKVLPNGMGGKPAPGRAQIGNWWTPERQQHAIDALTKGGVSELGAKGLVARWAAVESSQDGPKAVNPTSGAYGIHQALNDRKTALLALPNHDDFDVQLGQVLKELHTSETKALAKLNSAKTARDAAIGATMFERAGGWNAKAGTDNFTDKTEAAIALLGRQAVQQVGGNIPPVNGVGGLEQNQGGAQHRKEALSAALQRQLVAAAMEAGVNVDTFSGGQDPAHQYGSTRHNHGNAADIRLYKLAQDGQRRYLDQRNEEDRKVMESFLRSAVKNGATGIGAGPGYMGGTSSMHVGGGTPSAWGAGGSSATAPDWVRRALEYGLDDRKRATAAPVDKPAVARPNMTPGGFDPNHIDMSQVMKPQAALGYTTNSTSNDNRSVHQTFHTTTTIHGARDTREAGRMMEGTFGRMHGLALANAQSAVA